MMAHFAASAPSSAAAVAAAGPRALVHRPRRPLVAARSFSFSSSPSPPSDDGDAPPASRTSSTTSTTVIAPPPPSKSVASVSTGPTPSPGDPEVFPPPGLPVELAGEWDAAAKAVQALLERAAAERASGDGSSSPPSSSGPPARRRRAGGRDEPDAPPELAAQRHVARAFGWGSQAYWRHAVVCAAPEARRVEKALAFLCGSGEESSSSSLGMSAVEAADVLKSFPELLFLDADARLGANAAQLKAQWRLEGSVLRGAIARNPRALGYDVDCQGSCVGDCHRCWARF